MKRVESAHLYSTVSVDAQSAVEGHTVTGRVTHRSMPAHRLLTHSQRRRRAVDVVVHSRQQQPSSSAGVDDGAASSGRATVSSLQSLCSIILPSHLIYLLFT